MMKNTSNPGTGGHLIILSGPRGAGKTSLIQKTLEHLQNESVDIAGILSLPVEEDGEKIAIAGLDLRNGETRCLAVRNPGLSGDLATRQWLFESQALQWADSLLEVSTPCDLLVVDELGVLEFERGQGWLSGLKALDDGRYSAAIAVIRPELLAQAKARWPKSVLIEVTEESRGPALTELERIVRTYLSL
jgi:nucleoside-triphosphatase THEP1